MNVIKEIIEPGVNGDLIKCRDHIALAESIIKIIKNKNLMKKYGNNSFKLYKEKYSEEVFYKQYMDVLERILF